MTDHKPKRGRPPAVAPRSSVSAWILTSHHDRLIQLAKAADASVSEIVGQAIAQAIRAPRAPFILSTSDPRKR